MSLDFVKGFASCASECTHRMTTWLDTCASLRLRSSRSVRFSAPRMHKTSVDSLSYTFRESVITQPGTWLATSLMFLTSTLEPNISWNWKRTKYSKSSALTAAMASELPGLLQILSILDECQANKEKDWFYTSLQQIEWTGADDNSGRATSIAAVLFRSIAPCKQTQVIKRETMHL